MVGTAEGPGLNWPRAQVSPRMDQLHEETDEHSPVPGETNAQCSYSPILPTIPGYAVKRRSRILCVIDLGEKKTSLKRAIDIFQIILRAQSNVGHGDLL